MTNTSRFEASGRAVSRRSLLTGVATALAGGGVLAAGPSAHAAAWEDVYVDTFSSYAALETSWNYLYPWGSDHNGSARMYASATDHAHVSVSDGVLTLRASRLDEPEVPSSHDPHLPVWYRSGAVHGRTPIVVDDRYPSWEVRGDFQAPSAAGTWPAFWLTAVEGWPPESDILEFKGSDENWFNTFLTPTDVLTRRVTVPSPSSWHTYRAWLEKVNATDVDIHYYLDGEWQAVHRAVGFAGQPMHLIINLQMEGASGGPGPDGDTLYRARNVYVGRTVA